ncbi:MAG: GNAT family N-acetyltransferase [Roseovarius sp.]|uniref:GNAT family N-acetyltransferase n=1 Tax=Roseovarius sp. TaxID=1486281 RepID=UPI0032ECE333
MTPEEMAACHARAFAGHGRAWSAREFADLLDSPHVFAVGDGRAFAIGRAVADEAELLTIATDPARRRQGLGRETLTAFEIGAAERGASRIFLEVSAGNAAAIALYRFAGYDETGRRKGYYQGPDGREDAVLLEKQLD